MDAITIAVAASSILSAVAIGLSLRRRKLSLEQIARLACDHGEHLESPTLPRWRLAQEAATKLDLRDNGKRDYTDVQLRAALDAEEKRRGWVRR